MSTATVRLFTSEVLVISYAVDSLRYISYGYVLYAYALALPLGMGAQDVFAAIAISESVLAVVVVLVFRRGKWKLRRV